MNSKTITGGYGGGYALSSSYSVVTLTPSGYVAGTGLGLHYKGQTVINGGYLGWLPQGKHDGVALDSDLGGAVVNHGTIDGYGGVKGAGDPISVTNFGTLAGGIYGVDLIAGGTVVNEAPSAANAYASSGAGAITSTGAASTAIIIGGAGGTVRNAGLIDGGSLATGVSIVAGLVVNGGAYDPAGRIGANDGVLASGVTRVENYGAISYAGGAAPAGHGGIGVDLEGGGYLLNGSASDPGALIEANSPVIAVAADVRNFGTIDGPGNTGSPHAGVSLKGGADLVNGAQTAHGALIEGADGVYGQSAATTVTNFGVIVGTGEGLANYGVELKGGVVTNGAATDTQAQIKGYAGLILGGAGAMTNFGLIDATGLVAIAYGVDMTGGGSFVNGAPGDTSALIEGYTGVGFRSAMSSVVNYGSILGLGQSGEDGMSMSVGGFVNNGGGGDTSALIKGAVGLYWGSAGGELTNTGTVIGTNGNGVYSQFAALVFNGASDDRTALISGYGDGVYLAGTAASQVANYGTVRSTGELVGVFITAGTVTNGGAADRTALIEGAGGVVVSTGAGTVDNFGSIVGAGGGYGVALLNGGSVDNGSASDAAALIEGLAGVKADGVGAVSNFGTIAGLGSAGAFGLYLGGGASLTNGAADRSAATIAGYVGVTVVGGGQVASFGAILGEGGSAIDVVGGAGAIDNYGTVLAQGGATAAAVELAAGGLVRNGAGSDTSALIGGFTGVDMGAAGTVVNLATIAGQNGYGVVLRGGGDVVNGGGADRVALIEGYIGVDLKGAGTIANAGTIASIAFGPFAGVYLGGGTLTNGSLVNSAALVSGYDGVKAFSATVVNFATIAALGDVDAYGVMAGAGAAVANHGLIVGYRGAIASTGATITNFGTIKGIGGVAVQFAGDGDTLAVEAGSAFAGAVKGDGGTLVLGSGTGAVGGLFSTAGAKVTGSMAPTTFQAFDTVQVASGARFTDADAKTTLAAADRLVVIGGLTLSGAIANAGTIVASSAGGFTITGALTNNDRLIASAGTLTLEGVVTGTGLGQIDAGTLKAAASSTFDQNVVFAAGATGTLELAHGQTYAGTIGGFSLTGKTALDLDDIGYVSGTTKATYAGTASGGVLTVTSGGKVARIHFTGDYLASTWTLSSDGHGGTKIVDPTPPVHIFVQAAAGLSASPAGSLTSAPERGPQAPTCLGLPRGAAA